MKKGREAAPSIEKLTGEVAETNHGFWILLILGEIGANNSLERVWEGAGTDEADDTG